MRLTALLAAAVLLPATLAHAANIQRATAPMRVGENEYKVAYQIRDGAAKKPPVVFVHGWCASGEVWDIQLKELKTPRALIAIDLIGHGASDAPEELDYSMDTLADSVKAVLDQLGYDKAVLVGHSNGTPTIRAFYNKYPKATEALVTVDGPLYQMFRADQLGPILNALQGEQWQTFLGSQLDSMTAQDFSPEQAANLKEIALAMPQYVAVGTLEGAVDDSIWTDKPIGVPLMVVNAESPFWDDSYEKRVKQLNPDTEYHVLDQATHYLLIDEAERFNALLEAFLKSL